MITKDISNKKEHVAVFASKIHGKVCKKTSFFLVPGGAMAPSKFLQITRKKTLKKPLKLNVNS